VSARKRSRTTIALGLIENQNAKGEASYTSTVWATGERYTRTFTEVTRTQAKKLHIEHQHEVKNEGIKPARRDMTFLELKTEAFAYLQAEIDKDGGEANGVKPTTLRNYEIALKRIPNDPIWRVRLDKFDDTFAIGFLKRLRSQHKSDMNPKGYEWKTLHETATAVRTILRYGIEQRHLRVDPFGGVPRKYRIPQHANEENVKDALAPREIRMIVAAAKSDEFVEATDTLLSNLVIQAFCEGERIGETRHTRWRDCDLVYGILTTRGTKSVRSRKRPQAAQRETTTAWERQLEQELKKGLGNPDDYVYTLADGSGEPVTVDMARVAVERAGKIAGLGHITPMNARKSVATADHLAGVDDERSAAKLGHTKDVKMKHYVRPPHDLEALVADRDRRAAYLKLDEEG
jgi:integrase